jgi:hypothetical protein
MRTRKEIRIVGGLAAGNAATRIGTQSTNPAPESAPRWKGTWTRNGFDRTIVRALLSLAVAGVAVTLSGCLSIHTQKETDHPAPVIVVPQNNPNP